MGMPVITPSATTRAQAVTDIIESVALEEAALSHILNAEGEKIRAFRGRPFVHIGSWVRGRFPPARRL